MQYQGWRKQIFVCQAEITIGHCKVNLYSAMAGVSEVLAPALSTNSWDQSEEESVLGRIQ